MFTMKLKTGPVGAAALLVICLIVGGTALMIQYGYSLGTAVVLTWLSSGLLVPPLYLAQIKIAERRRKIAPARDKSRTDPVASTPGQ